MKPTEPLEIAKNTVRSGGSDLFPFPGDAIDKIAKVIESERERFLKAVPEEKEKWPHPHESDSWRMGWNTCRDEILRILEDTHGGGK